ncbi:MAG: O-antigen ligase family protein [Bryobacteraceae bacterium]|nr:O-antigen ligase family protein [Bryobacteraceae bacterium]
MAVIVGLTQHVTGATAYEFQTRSEIVYWLVAFACVFLARQLFEYRGIRNLFLQVFLYFGVAISLVAVLQYHTSDGRVFWLFPARYEDMLGPFQNRNNFTAFLELLVPLALYKALADRKRRTWYLVMAAILVAAAVASLSRTGTLLIVAETVVIFLIAAKTGLLPKGDLIRVGACAIAAAGVLIFAVGWEPLWGRLQSADPLIYRREIMQSTVAMIRERPWSGFGLGAYQTVYPAFALFDVGLIVNHAHNEWLEWAAEGGLPLSAALLSVAVWVIGPAYRSVWGLGLVAIFVHAMIDYPLQRLGVSAWVYVLLAALAAEAEQEPGRPLTADEPSP